MTDGILDALKLRRADQIRHYEHEIKVIPALVIKVMLIIIRIAIL